MENALCTPVSEFKYWFYPDVSKSHQYNSRVWSAISMSNEDMEPIYYDEYKIICMECDESEIVHYDILTDFNKFKENRPEYYLHPYDFDVILDTLNDMKEKYDALMAGCILETEKSAEYSVEEDEKLQKKVTRCLNWLVSTNFYRSPASTRYHEAYEFGLLEHTLKVVKNIVDLYSMPKFSSIKLSDAILVALMHDFCKIGKYAQDLRWQKDENNQWEQVPYFKYAEEPKFAFGHGTGSMFVAESLVKLTTEQKLAIRWHMGRWYVAESDVNDLQYCNENYPLVHMLQFADQLAITNY